MTELLLLADDFTGALDTGVQFAQQNIPTLVSTRIEQLDQGAGQEFPVFVLDTESRHLSAAEARIRVTEAVQPARARGVRFFYKKTDSTLRGNIGGELAALIEAAGSPFLAFVPAYPKNGRLTISGRQYVDGVPLHRSVYGRDLQNPVYSSYVPDIIAAQTPTPVQVVERSDSLRLERPAAGESRIAVFDAQTDEDLRRIAGQLKARGLLGVTAGCAGFAEYLPAALGLSRGTVPELDCPSRLLIVCGSTNPVSLQQIEAAVRSGVERVVLHPAQLLPNAGSPSEVRFEEGMLERIEQTLSSGRDLILQTARREEDIRRLLEYARDHGIEEQSVPRLTARAIGALVGSILQSFGELTPVVFGGDTAVGILEALGLLKVRPIEQISQGVVLSRLVGESADIPLITKAGGFGSIAVIREIQCFMSGDRP